MVDAFGSITWWGFSPALDLQKESSNLSSKLDQMSLKDEEEGKEPDPFNVLMVGAGDCRHILKTLAHAKRWPKRKINFYVAENSLELLGKHLLLLSIALEPKENLGLKEKTELFLELFGNSLIRPQTCEYLQNKANEFIRMVTDFDYLQSQLPCINMSQLKFKERDMLEGIFKFWRNTDPKTFDICISWESRLRQYLGVRFDARVNVFDWDLVMKLQKMASIVHSYEYKGWREHGVAFELREDSTYEISNRTLASGLLLKKSDQRVPCRGYWGDIINSPYLSFGIESEEQQLFKVNNRQHIKTSTNVAEFNITALMHELMTGERYKLPEDVEDKKTKAPHKATITEIIEEEEEDDESAPGEQKTCHEDDQDGKQSKSTPGYLQLDGCTIYFMPLNCVPDLHKKSKYSRLFHCMYFSNSMVHLLNPDIQNLMADVAMVTTELTKFMLDLQAEQKNEYLKRVTGMAEAAGCKAVKDYDGQKDDHATFMFQRKEKS